MNTATLLKVSKDHKVLNSSALSISGHERQGHLGGGTLNVNHCS